MVGKLVIVLFVVFLNLRWRIVFCGGEMFFFYPLNSLNHVRICTPVLRIVRRGIYKKTKSCDCKIFVLFDKKKILSMDEIVVTHENQEIGLIRS